MEVDFSNIVSILFDNLARATVITAFGSTGALIYFEEVSNQETPEIISSAVIILALVGFLAGLMSIAFLIYSAR